MQVKKSKKTTATTLMKEEIATKVAQVKALGFKYHDFANHAMKESPYMCTSEGANEVKNAFYGRNASVFANELLDSYLLAQEELTEDEV